VVLFVWFVPARGGRGFVPALLVGLALAGLGGSWDYAWSTSAWAAALATLLAAAALWALAALPDPGPGPSWGLSRRVRGHHEHGQRPPRRRGHHPPGLGFPDLVGTWVGIRLVALGQDGVQATPGLGEDLQRPGLLGLGAGGPDAPGGLGGLGDGVA
jgi:hypothetical protein